MNRRDPRIRQTLDRFQSNIETANLNAQAGVYDIVQYYINPCLRSVGECLQEVCEPCFPAPRRSRPRHLSRGNRPEQSFDFYNDIWDEDYADDGEPTERTGLLSGWGAPDLDRLLAGTSGGGSPGGSEQPHRHAGMTYGSRGPPSAGLGGPARVRSVTTTKGGELDPNEVPASSMFGFLESLPFKIGRRGFRYRPSAASLQENLHRKSDDRYGGGSGQRLLDESDADEDFDDEHPPRLPPRRGLSAVIAGKGHHSTPSAASGSGPSRPRTQRRRSDPPTLPPSRHGRNRSGTTESHTSNASLSSRGDLFPSDDEDDAVPLDDEFATALERRTTSSGRRRSSGDGMESGESRSGSNMRSGISNPSTPSSKKSRSRSNVLDSEEESEARDLLPDPEMRDDLDSSQVLEPEEHNMEDAQHLGTSNSAEVEATTETVPAQDDMHQENNED